ncbi:MAG TPA: twin-arginine translocase subunit TatC [Streptosporangiaceae bacterium]|nr:twin-arginine translocase subunit TatC [Streptosporangiaceae bacterium]
MSLIEHIRELRNRVFKALLFVTAGAIAGWFIEEPVFKFITGPYCKLPVRIRDGIQPGLPASSQPHNCHLIVTGLFDYFFLHLKLAIVIGIVISAPFWMYQLWAFVAPGLHRRERRWTYLFVGTVFPLFAIGGTFAYFAMTKGLRFLLGMLPQTVVPFISVTSYIGYAIAMLLIFGLAFELPMVMVLLNLAGVLTHQRFAKWRRMIIFAVFAFAAVATPSPDPISMLLLAVPCVALVEGAEIFAWANDRRRAKRGVVYPGLSDDEVADYGLETERVMASDLDDVDASR